MLGYAIRRLLAMIPALAAVSLLIFAVVELPPGDYLANEVQELQSQGEGAGAARVAFLRQEFSFDRPFLERYAIWAGLWPGPHGFDGLLQGEWGWSFVYAKPVADVLGDRIGLTALLNLATVLLVYLIAFPVGLMAARRPGGLVDIGAAGLSYLGLAIPSFLLALVLLSFAHAWFGLTIGGLVSPAYRDAPWSLAKAFDVAAHLVIPALVIALGSAGIMIRRLRANLLDEVNKPYVVAARARGIGEARLMTRYPLRLAFAPFVADIGNLLPSLVSGSVIVSVVLNLQTVGPVLLAALRAQDTFLAAFILLFTAVLTLAGMLVSDLILALLDPRVRLGQKARL
ncbi:MAG: ABC transporter permease [Alphaproteobacteria bacterium]|nr:ABC transporter permease [Alphaproteobacteria bacterium]